ncbi:MAG TPA: ribonuclease HI [Candidatus Binataceae bacterium]|nr:ribonuclease HI [Candidatus Binataceae bacterium]
MKSVQLITDGACKGNPGRGGWACILRFGKLKRELFGCSPYTTNNRMELAGAIEGLRRLKEPCTVEIITDSEYLRNGITSWIKGWKKNGWKTASKKPVTNKDLWLMLDELVNTHKIVWTWTKGHASHEDNNRCDELASEAAVMQLNSEPDSHNDLYRKQDGE